MNQMTLHGCKFLFAQTTGITFYVPKSMIGLTSANVTLKGYPIQFSDSKEIFIASHCSKICKWQSPV